MLFNVLTASSDSVSSSFLAVPTYIFPTFKKFIRCGYSVSKHYTGSKDIRKLVPFGRAMILESKKIKVTST